MNVEEHSQYYFPDGDIALAVRASPTTVQVFRVHRVCLSNASSVFRDMFSLPVTAADDTYNGIPLVRMPDDDSAADFEMLFGMIYNITYFHELMSMPKANVPLELAGLARLARKYMLQDVTSVIVRRVKDSWPDQYFRWEEQSAFRAWANTDCPTSGTPHVLGTTLDDFPEPVASIVFAFEHDIDLPAALYKLCITSPDSHWPHDDNPAHRRWPCFQSDMHKPSARWRLASREMLSAFILAREQLHQSFKAKVETMGSYLEDSPTRNCEANSNKTYTCIVYLYTTFSTFQQDLLPQWRHDMDCFQMLTSLKDRVATSDVCKRCRTGMCNAIDVARYGLWDSLEVNIWPSFKEAAMSGQ